MGQVRVFPFGSGTALLKVLFLSLGLVGGPLVAQPVSSNAHDNFYQGGTTALCDAWASTWSSIDPRTSEPRVAFSVPFEARSLQQVGGAFYCIGKSPMRLATEKERFVYPLYRSASGKDWKEIGRLEASWKGNIRVLFLDERRFVAMTIIGGFAKDGRTSKMALMTLDAGGMAQVEELVDRGMPTSCRLGLPPQAKYARIPDGWVVADRLTGIVHTFRLKEHAVSVNVTHLYPSVTEHLKQNRPVYGPIYAIQAMPDGQVLFATTTENAMLEAGEVTRTLLEGSPENVAEAYALALKQTEGLDPNLALDLLEGRMKDFTGKGVGFVTDLVCKGYPDLLWWEFDPVRQRFQRVDPPGAPSVIRGMEDVENLQFYYLPAGRLVVKTKPS